MPRRRAAIREVGDEEDYERFEEKEEATDDPELEVEPEDEVEDIDSYTETFITDNQDELNELVVIIEEHKQLKHHLKEVQEKKKELMDTMTRRFNRLPRPIRQKGIKYETVKLKMKTKTKVQRCSKDDLKTKTLRLLNEYVPSKKAEDLYQKLQDVSIEATTTVDTLDIKQVK